jgi:Zn-dependent protease/CBS domain-containing protein
VVRGARGQLTFRLARVWGIELNASWSWILMSLLLVSIAGGTFHSLLVGVPTWLVWLLAVIASLLVVGSLYAHELAHAAVARSFGLPVRSISLFLLGGLAHIRRDSPSPRAELLIALAGPCLSLAIGVLAALVSWVCWQSAPPVAVLALWLAALNLPLAIFNLVPAYPLDGGRVLRSVLWFAGEDVHWGSVMAARAGELLAAGLLLAGIFVLVTQPASAIGALWLMLVAWFLFMGAVNARRAAEFSDSLSRITVASVMQRSPPVLDAGMTVSAFVAEYPAHATRAAAVYRVVQGEQVVGLVGYAEVRRVVPTRWPSTLIADVMLPLGSTPAVTPDAAATRALQLVVEEGIERVPVMTDGRLDGVVTSADLARAAARREPKQR